MVVSVRIPRPAAFARDHRAAGGPAQARPPFHVGQRAYICESSRSSHVFHGVARVPRLPVITSTDRTDRDGQSGLLTKTRPKTQRPPLYKVILLNDDYTPMEFVVHVLERFFGMNHAQAFDLMLTVHKKGLAVVGVFSFEVAETKVAQVMDFARRHQHPLQCTMERE
jgi:ATP-dependent Clp protease adaptor protein ClpS